jgi:hypothetical protein
VDVRRRRDCRSRFLRTILSISLGTAAMLQVVLGSLRVFLVVGEGTEIVTTKWVMRKAVGSLHGINKITGISG